MQERTTPTFWCFKNAAAERHLSHQGPNSRTNNLTMNRFPVDSRSIESIGYDQPRLTLEIEFRDSGRIYDYLQVPETEFRAFLAAESKGTYLNQVLKKKGYICILVSR